MKASYSLDILHFPMKNIKSCRIMGGATSKQARDVVCLFLLACCGVGRVRHSVKCKHLTFLLFQNYVKLDLMSNNMQMSDDVCN